MKTAHTPNIKNVALLGHGSSGKTSLAEALLYTAKSIDRLGTIADGTTTLDFDNEEHRKRCSVSTAVAALTWNDKKINLIDAPGMFDFAAGTNEAVRAADAVLICLSGKSGLASGAEIAYKQALNSKRALPKIFFVGKLDSPSANFFKVLDQLKTAYGNRICPVVVPYMDGDNIIGYINLLRLKAYKYNNGISTEIEMPPLEGRYKELYDSLCEAVAMADEELMEEYFEGQTFTTDELVKGLFEGVHAGDIDPVLCGSALALKGIDMLLDGLCNLVPPCEGETAEIAGEEVQLKCDENGPFAAVVFKTVVDPFVGKLSYFKVISGSISKDKHFKNQRTGEEERASKVMIIVGAKQQEVETLFAGDIGCISKLGDVLTGDTLCECNANIKLDPVHFQSAILHMAVVPKTKGTDEKVAAGYIRMMEEDPTLEFYVNHETHQQILGGLGEQHLEVANAKLKAKFGVEVSMSIPRVAYRETIRSAVKVQGKHKKQSGGHGQFGDVWIEFSPTESETLVFEEKVFGGVVPKNFFPAVEKGLQECMHKGVLAGYPVVGLKATLVDGSYHPVDSSEMSFKMAAHEAFKAGLTKATPIILEPIGLLKALVKDENMGDVIGEINKRRGRVHGMTPNDGWKKLKLKYQ